MTLAAVILAALIIAMLGVAAAQLSRGKRLPSDPNLLKKGINLIMSKADPDFPSQPTYTQTTNSNSSWVNVTVTKTNSDGTRTQTSHIEPRVKG